MPGQQQLGGHRDLGFELPVASQFEEFRVSSQANRPFREAIQDPAAIEAHMRQLWTRDVLDVLGKRTTPLADHIMGERAPDGIVNPYWSIVRWLPQGGWKMPGPGSAEVDGWMGHTPQFPVRRDNLAFSYSFAIPSPGDIAFLAKHIAGRKVIELGAGTGYWAWQLSQVGVDVIAYDSHAWVNNGVLSDVQFHPVQQGSVEKIPEHPDRVLMLCWPDYDTSFARDALNAYDGDCLIYIGEGWGGCTGDDEFGKQLDEEWVRVASSGFHVNFTGIHSDIGLYRRARPSRRQISAGPEIAKQLDETVSP